MSFSRWRGVMVAMAVGVAAAVVALPAQAQVPAKEEVEFKPDAVPRGQYLGQSSALTSSGSTKPEYFLAIYSGSTSGTYFKVATTICNVMRQRFEEHRIRCVPLRSQGVASNRALMRQGRAQVMLVQSDTNWQASVGEEPIPSARSVASLYNESGVLVARRDAGIKAPQDIRGKRLSVGTEGSAARKLWVDFLGAMNLAEEDFEILYSLGQDYNTQGVCDDYIDAYGLWIGHPTTAIATALASCDVSLIGMAGDGAKEMLTQKPYYYDQVIPAGTYAGQDQDLITYGLKAVLVADYRADPYIIYWLARTLVEEVDALGASNPVLRALDPEQLFSQGNFLPFHAGAERYWREKGWLRPATN